jgi:hypothetical protein
VPVAFLTPRKYEWKPREKFVAPINRRLAFADWLTQPDHPITARLVVNRLWHQHFGAGLVDPPDNFGITGAKPSHPELLDWLATELVRGGWRLKPIHRLIVASSVYQQSSALDAKSHAKAMELDPSNRLLWRRPTRRLEGEVLRDSMLASAGNLNRAMFGPPVGVVATGEGEVVAPDGAPGQRRSIYLLVRRSQPMTLLSTFDSPVMERNCTLRSRSTVSSQALVLLNSSFAVRQAEALASRVLRERPIVAGADPAPAIEWAYRLALARPPRPAETARATAFLKEQSAVRAAEQPTAAPTDAAKGAWNDFCHMLLCTNEFLYVD